MGRIASNACEQRIFLHRVHIMDLRCGGSEKGTPSRERALLALICVILTEKAVCRSDTRVAPAKPWTNPVLVPGSSNKAMRIFTAEEHVSEYCQGNNRVLGASYVADWFADAPG